MDAKRSSGGMFPVMGARYFAHSSARAPESGASDMPDGRIIVLEYDGAKSLTVSLNDGAEVTGTKGTDGNYTFAVAGHTLTLNSTTGDFSYNGVPTSGKAADYKFTFTATDGDGDTATPLRQRILCTLAIPAMSNGQSLQISM